MPRKFTLDTDYLPLHDELVAEFIQMGYHVQSFKESKRFFFFGKVSYKSVLSKEI